MQHVIYSGTGTFDSRSYMADYFVYLPALTTGTYQFITNKIFNMSCSQYPNTILMFMRVVGGSNSGFTGCTEQRGTLVTFNISPSSILSTDPNCTPLDYTKPVYVIIMHDDTFNLPDAIETCYCKAPVISTCPQDPEEGEINKPSVEKNPPPYGGPQYKKYGKMTPHGF